MELPQDFEIKPTYDWGVRAFTLLKNRLSLNIRFHHDEGQIERGQIFLFNHFARFETVIPQYLIHRQTGAYCRCVATHELFKGSESFAKFLLGVGAVPNNMPGLLPFLAAEILRGRKVIVFPEGGQVKDRRVMNDKGDFSVFSPSAKEMRKHHKGAAVIALTLEIFKKRILSVYDEGDHQRIERWVQALGLKDSDELIQAARQPTFIVPANITFFPLRTCDNILRKSADFFAKGMKDKYIEELLIEGNILFKETDMDIRLGNEIPPHVVWRWWDRFLLARVFQQIDSLEDLFELKHQPGRWVERLLSMCLRRETDRLRDIYMREIYAAITVNICHLASQLVLQLIEAGREEIPQEEFRRLLYLALKTVQEDESVFLHPSITDPRRYRNLERDSCAALDQFFELGSQNELVSVEADSYRFLPKLLEEQKFHQIRLENPIAVYANEAAPIAGVGKAVKKALRDLNKVDPAAMALLLLDDDCRTMTLRRAEFSDERYQEIHRAETATESGAPYLLMPKKRHAMGILAVHGFLASPAEMRGYSEQLSAEGYPVMGVRLAGHGTSPWDLRDQSWSDWLASLKRGYDVIASVCDTVAVVGFSTGGALALIHAADRPEKLAGVAAIAAPYKLRNKNLAFVPLVHRVNRLAEWVPSVEGVMPFRPNEPEHPEVNYRHIPVRGLYELRRVVEEMIRRLPEVGCPTALVQGDEDPVVDPKSMDLIHAKLTNTNAVTHSVSAQQHGILYDDIGDTREFVSAFLEDLSAGRQPKGEPRPRADDREERRAI
ncbi:MAG: alpha/beta fold hydrolase [Pseudomonadota bacterium]